MELLLYPYTKNNHFLLLGNGSYQISGVCTGHSQFVDMDFLDKHGIFFNSNLEESITKVDGILFYPDPMAVTLERTKKRLLDEVKLCLDHGKQVYCVMELTNEQQQMLKRQDDGNDRFHLIAPQISRSSLGKGEGVMKPCDTPIVYIGAICEGLQTEEFTVCISNTLMQRGYDVCTILDDPCAKMIGHYSTPEFMYEKSYDADKIFRFHNYVLSLDRSKTPDVFVIQIPGSIYPLCQDRYSDFAMKCLYYSRAFCPDVFLCVTPSNLCEEEMMARIHQDMKVQYGYGIDAIFYRELYLDRQEAFKYGQTSLMPVNYAEHKEQVLDCGEDKILIVGEKEDYAEEKFCDLIEKLLVNEEEFELL